MDIKITTSSFVMQLCKIIASKKDPSNYVERVNGHIEKANVEITPIVSSPFEVHYTSKNYQRKYVFSFQCYKALTDLIIAEIKMLYLVISFADINGYCEFDTKILTEIGIYKNQKDANEYFNQFLKKFKNISISVIRTNDLKRSFYSISLLNVISPAKKNKAVIEIPKLLMQELFYNEIYIPSKAFTLSDKEFLMFTAGINFLVIRKVKAIV